MEIEKLAIFGDSGHAKDIEIIVRNKNPNCKIVFITHENESKIVEECSSYDFKFIIGIGNNSKRLEISNKYQSLNWVSVIAESCVYSPDINLGEGSFIGHSVFISHNVKIGSHVIINANASIGHDATISNYSQICPSSTIGGNGVTIGEGTFLGSSVTVINKKISIGDWSDISFGSIISKDVASNVVYQQYRKEIILRKGLHK